MNSVQILDKGEIRLIDSMGDDLSIVRAARVSNASRPEDASKGEEQDKRLIRYLVKNKHTSPFEHVVFTFYIKCPLFIAREWHRHRTWSFNEISGRYVEFTPEFYIPKEFRIQAPTNKQGSLPPTDTVGGWEKDDWNSYNSRIVEGASQRAFDNYRWLLKNGVAKEMARMVLPLNLYTEFYGTIDAHNLLRFIELREASNAQFEIQEYARGLKELIKNEIPWTIEAWES